MKTAATDDAKELLATGLTTGMVARELELSNQRVLQLIATGQLHAVRTPLGHLFPVEEVRRAKAARRRR